MDDNPEYINETIKQLLIINYERKKKPPERTEIHENQIKHAIRNECLIIDTPTLLKIHDLFLNNGINTEELLNYIFETSGSFDFNEFEKTIEQKEI